MPISVNIYQEEISKRISSCSKPISMIVIEAEKSNRTYETAVNIRSLNGGITLRVVKHIMLWSVSTILLTLASFGLELLEGNKISTTEYYGFQNIGFVFIFLAFLFSAVLYPIIIFPLSWVVRMIANPLISRIAIILFGIAGSIYVLVDYYLDQRS